MLDLTDKEKNEQWLKKLSDTLFIPIWKDRNLSVIDQFCAADIEVRTTFYKGNGVQDAHKSFEILFEAFSKFDLRVEDLIEYDGRIAYKWSATAIQSKPILNMQSSEPLFFSGIVFLIFNS